MSERLTCGSASVCMARKDGLTYLHDLKGRGCFADMRGLVRMIQGLARSGPVHFSISGPSDRARRILERYGAVKLPLEVWKLGS